MAAYHIGLNLTVVMLVVRGILQVLGSPLSSGMDASISGISGIGHILLGISLILLLIDIRHNVADKEEKEYDPVYHRSSRPAR